MTVRPSSLIACSTSHRLRRACGSSAAVGSSRKTTAGSWMSEHAIDQSAPARRTGPRSASSASPRARRARSSPRRAYAARHTDRRRHRNCSSTVSRLEERLMPATGPHSRQQGLVARPDRLAEDRTSFTSVHGCPDGSRVVVRQRRWARNGTREERAWGQWIDVVDGGEIAIPSDQLPRASR